MFSTSPKAAAGEVIAGDNIYGVSYDCGQAFVHNLLNVPLVTKAALLHWWQVEPRKLMSNKEGPRPHDPVHFFHIYEKQKESDLETTLAGWQGRAARVPVRRQRR